MTILTAPHGATRRPVAGLDRAAERRLRTQVRTAVARYLEQRTGGGPGEADRAEVRALVRDCIEGYQRDAITANTPPLADPDAVEVALLDQVLGLGPLEPLLRDPAVQDIYVVHPGEVWTRREDGFRQEDVAFDTDEEVLQLVRRAVGPLGARLDESHPWCDVMLPEGTRLHCDIPPITPWVNLSLRKYVVREATLESLTERRMLSADLARFLTAAVAARLTVLISGDMGAGKTTLASAVLAAIPAGVERIVAIEDVTELAVHRRLGNAVSMRERAPNAEGAGAVPAGQLVRNSLRGGYTRLILGEVRGPEALEVLLALHAGQGGLTTIHARSARDALRRLVTLASMAPEHHPVAVLRDLAASTVDMVVHLHYAPRTGLRRVATVHEIVGLEEGPGGGVIVGQDLWTWDPDRDELRWTGVKPRCLERLAAYGIAYALPAGGQGERRKGGAP